MGNTAGYGLEQSVHHVGGVKKKISKAARKEFYILNSPLGLFFDEKERSKLVSIASLKTYKANTWLYNQGASADRVFILGVGSVKMFVDLEESKKTREAHNHSPISYTDRSFSMAEEPRSRSGRERINSVFADQEEEKGTGRPVEISEDMFVINKLPGDIIGNEWFVNHTSSKRLAHVKIVHKLECLVIRIKHLAHLCIELGHDFEDRIYTAFAGNIAEILAGTKLLCTSPDDIRHNPVLWGMWRLSTLNEGEILFEEGSYGKEIFVAYDGSVKLLFQEDTEHKSKRAEVQIPKGQIFGEIGVLVDTPRAGTVQAESPTVLLELGMQEFSHLLRHFPFVGRKLTESARHHVVRNFSKYNIPFFKSLTDPQYELLGRLCTIVQIPPGELIFDIGEYGDRFYMIGHGDVGIFVPMEDGIDDKSLRMAVSSLDFEEKVEHGIAIPNMTEVCRIGPGRYFGELALVTDSPRCATARAITRCVILSISKAKFDIFFDTNPEALLDFQIKLAKYKISLEQLLTHPMGVRYFLGHCQSEFSSENVLFYESAQQYRRAFRELDHSGLDKDYSEERYQSALTAFEKNEFRRAYRMCRSSDELKKLAHQVYERFISVDSLEQVNVPFEVRKTVTLGLQGDFGIDIFDEITMCIYDLMERDSFPRFKSSPRFQDFLREMEAYVHVPDDSMH